MATLIVRQVDDKLVDALKERAREAGRSAEAEHRLILNRALSRTKGSGAQLWQGLTERAPDLTDQEWENVERAIRSAQGRSASLERNDSEEPSRQAS